MAVREEVRAGEEDTVRRTKHEKVFTVTTTGRQHNNTCSLGFPPRHVSAENLVARNGGGGGRLSALRSQSSRGTTPACRYRNSKTFRRAFRPSATVYNVRQSVRARPFTYKQIPNRLYFTVFRKLLFFTNNFLYT